MRTKRERLTSAKARLASAHEWWGWEPHTGQRRLFCATAAVRVAACGRRWGKTECLSVDVATYALAEAGSRQLLVAPTETQARLLGLAVLDLLERATHGDEARGTLTHRTHPHLLLTVAGMDGTPPSEIMCRTAGRDGRGLRGLWAHRIIVDEAAYVPDRVLREVLPPMLADKGGEMLLASSPNGRRGAFYQLYARGIVPAGGTGGASEGVGYEAFQCATMQNAAHLDRAWLASQRDEMGESLYAQEFEAQFLDDWGAVFRAEDIDAAITDVPGVRLEDNEVRSKPQPGRLYVLGADWGRKFDYSVVVVLDATDVPARVVHLSRWRGTGWDAQAADAAAIIARFRPRRVLADGSSIGDPIAEMLTRQIDLQMPPGAHRPTVERFLFGAESKQALMDRLNVGLSARALQFPPHRALLTELRGFEYAPGGAHTLKMAARAGGHDDCVVALALAFYAAPDPAARRAGTGILLGSQAGMGRR